MKINKLQYPLIFEYSENGQICYHCPFFEEINDCADSFEEAYKEAKNSLTMSVQSRIEHNDLEKVEISDFMDLSCEKNSKIFIMDVPIKKRYIKKSVTISEDLNERALEEGINLSLLLREALIKKFIELDMKK